MRESFILLNNHKIEIECETEVQSIPVLKHIYEHIPVYNRKRKHNFHPGKIWRFHLGNIWICIKDFLCKKVQILVPLDISLEM